MSNQIDVLDISEITKKRCFLDLKRSYLDVRY